jgi:hypothetical protein
VPEFGLVVLVLRAVRTVTVPSPHVSQTSGHASLNAQPVEDIVELVYQRLQQARDPHGAGQAWSPTTDLPPYAPRM